MFDDCFSDFSQLLRLHWEEEGTKVDKEIYFLFISFVIFTTLAHSGWKGWIRQCNQYVFICTLGTVITQTTSKKSK